MLFDVALASWVKSRQRSDVDYWREDVALGLSVLDIVVAILTAGAGAFTDSKEWRPMLVIGFDDPAAENSAHHDLRMSTSFWNRLPSNLQRHFDCPIVDQLEPLEQRHLIDGLLEPARAD